jgi:hypothetical protein
MEIRLTDRVRKEVVLHRVKEDRNTQHRISRWKANWIGYILRRKCLLKHVSEGKKDRRKGRSDGKTRNKT